MALFENCSMLLELKNLPFKEKKKLKSAVTENGGKIAFVVNEQCSLVVTNDVCNLSSNRLRSIRKHHTPVVGMDYIYACVDRGILLPVAEHRKETSPFSALSQSSPSTIIHLDSHKAEVVTTRMVPKLSKGQAKAAAEEEVESQEGNGNILERFRIYTEMDSYPPAYPDNFQVAKYSFFQKTNGNSWCVLELQSVRGEEGQRFRVVRYSKERVGAEGAAVRDRLVFPTTSEEALEVYQALIETLQASGLQLRDSVPPQAPDLGSAPLQQLLLEEKMNTGVLSPAVGVFVELLWSEALGCLGSILRVPISKLSLNDVSRAEGLLIQAHKKQKEGCHEEVLSLLGEVNTLLPHKVFPHPPSAKLISQKLDLCQLIRDVLSVSEMCLRSPVPSSLGKYRALRCSIECIPLDSPEFEAVATLLQDSKVQIQQVLRVGRGVELQTFKSELGNIKSLLHSSSPSNFVGILSRGLLLPCVGVEQHGISRTDVGNLGSGIYFSDAASTCLKYSKPSVTDGSRLLLVCDVALGVCKDVHKRDTTLTQAPEGHDSVHAVRRTPNAHSEFEDDEYVVYSPDQVKLKYVVQFITDGDEQKEFQPSIDISGMSCLPSADPAPSLDSISEDDSLENIKNPLDDVKAGLLDSSGQQLPLQAVHVKCKLMDLLSQVIIFQKYTNLSSVPIEAKYVFPLGDSAAVCGFEAFINGKHVVGQVKEKETARKEYKQAIEKGHGAYLMDQDAADVFTISVGNLPPGATVLIKVTFVSELIVRLGTIVFSLPGSVAPWQESTALNQTTQATLEKVCVTGEDGETRDFTLDVSIEMPYEITYLRCTTHQVKMKKTDCKAVVSVLPGEVMGPEGFQLSVTLSEVHLPRMWVENHPDEDLQACMLVFYPDFDINRSSEFDEVILLLDTSESMRGETLCTARRLALRVLRALYCSVRVNVIFFGTDHSQAFQRAKPLREVQDEAEKFIKSFSPVGGSTELWQPLRALSLLPPSRGMRNILLFSDGHIQNAEFTLRLLRDNAQHSRLFTCGLSTTANRHMLRALTQAGGGAYEFFDTKTKHTWAEKVTCQVRRMQSPGCNSVSVKWQQFNPEAPRPVQAPQQVHALFNDCPTLVYGFVAHCTQATLLGNLSGQELNTMVSTTELQKTKGTFLHKLTARALIRDYEDGNLDSNEAMHEGRKAELKSYIIKLSKEYSILSQFTSFVAIEERDPKLTEVGFTDIPKLIAEEDVDILPYIGWAFPCVSVEEFVEGMSFELDTEGMENYSITVVISKSLCGRSSPPETSDILDFAMDSDNGSKECALSARQKTSDLLDPLLDEGSMNEMSDTGSDTYFGQNDSMEFYEDMCSRDIPTPPSPPPPPPPLPYSSVKDVSSLSHVGCIRGLSAASSDISTEQLPLRSQFTVDRIMAKSVAQVMDEPEIDQRSTANLKRRSLRRVPSVPSKESAAVESATKVRGASLSRTQSVSEKARTFAEVLAGPPPPPPRPEPIECGAPSPIHFSAHRRGRRFFDALPSAAIQSAPKHFTPPILPPPLLGRPQTLVEDSLSLPKMGQQKMRGFSFCKVGAPAAAVPSAALTSLGLKEHTFGRTSSPAPASHMFSSNAAPAAIPSPAPGPSLPGALYGFSSDSAPAVVPSPAQVQGASKGFGSTSFAYGAPMKSLGVRPHSFKGFGSSSSDSALPFVPSAAEASFSFQHLGPSSSDSTPPVPTFPAPAPPALRVPLSLHSNLECLELCAMPFSLETQACSLQRMQFASDIFGEPSLFDESVDESGSSGSGQVLFDKCVTEELEESPSRAQLLDDDAAINLTLQVSNSMRDDLMLDQLVEEGTRQPLKKKMRQGAPSSSEQTKRKSTRSPAGPELRNINWTRIFSIQRPKGYWEPTTELGQLIDVNLDVFANEFLKNKGIQSLGVKANADILRLLATLLVLQLLRVQGLTEGKLLRTLFCLEDSPSRPKWWEQVKLAVDWVLWADRQYPCIYSRLEFGQSWESSTRQLLGCDRFPPFSPLRGLKLREPANILLVH